MKCELCNDTGFYGDNGPGQKGNREYVQCDCTKPERFEHVCKRCGEPFSNTSKDCEYCCVCEVRNQRDEWDK
jgi:hypothetical protein